MLHPRSEIDPSMTTFDEASMERSKNFVKALQELKNLRPQLYSAAEYCEKSYLHSDQKQMVLDNLKDYAVRALVNAVDHLGTVAYKLTDLFEQQTLDVSTMELNISCLNQQLLTCQSYTEKEGMRQQQLVTIIPRHHKHYILPNSINKKVQFSQQIQTDARQKHIVSRPRGHPSGNPLSSTLSWHLASETKSTLDGNQMALINPEEVQSSGKASSVFRLLDAKEAVAPKSSSAHPQFAPRSPVSTAVLQTLGITRKDSPDASKPLTTYRSFENQGRKDTIRAPGRSKSMLSAFFPKQKTAKLKSRAVS